MLTTEIFALLKYYLPHSQEVMLLPPFIDHKSEALVA